MSQQNRKKQFIDPEVQGALARRMVLQWGLFLVTAGVLTLTLEWMRNPFVPFGETVSQTWSTFGPVLMVLACLAPVFIFDAIKLSNRFTGPMHRIRLAARELAEGKVPERITFRGGDFWQELAKDFNAMLDRVDSLTSDSKDKPNASRDAEELASVD